LRHNPSIAWAANGFPQIEHAASVVIYDGPSIDGPNVFKKNPDAAITVQAGILQYLVV
jgi:hypothetical protein